LTDQITSVSGLVTNGRGDVVKDYWTVVFARDRDKWSSGRYIRTARGDQDGRFKFSGLPATEYLVIAVDSIDPNEVNDPELLGRLEPRAQIARPRRDENARPEAGLGPQSRRGGSFRSAKPSGLFFNAFCVPGLTRYEGACSRRWSPPDWR
jgi:hypothetical protein